MNKFSQSFLHLLEHLYRIRETLIWLPLNVDDTEESLFNEILSYIDDYKKDIHNPCPVGDKTDITKEV